VTNAVLVLVLLVAPVSALVGVAIGAFLTFRVMRGQSPLPTLPRTVKFIDDKAAPANGAQRAHPPKLRA